MPRRIIVGISGASGVIYGVRMLEHLRKTDCETHLVLSKSARLTIEIETSFSAKEVVALADHSHDNKNMAASISSGSFVTDGMIVAPCTIKTLSGIANSYTENLLVRAADVCLKEKRKLVLMVRETPLHKGHLQLMSQAADLGAHILPPVPSFYHQPATIDDIIDQSIGKVFDYMGIEHHLFDRWSGLEPSSTRLRS